MKVITERVERIIITTKLDDAAIDKALAYCKDNGYEVTYRNPLRDRSGTRLNGKFRIVAEKPIEAAK